jgi:hypothetical protein
MEKGGKKAVSEKKSHKQFSWRVEEKGRKKNEEK